MSSEEIYPLPPMPCDKRCKCGHRFSHILAIRGGINISLGAAYGLGCPECGAVRVVMSNRPDSEKELKDLFDKVATLEKELREARNKNTEEETSHEAGVPKVD